MGTRTADDLFDDWRWEPISRGMRRGPEVMPGVRGPGIPVVVTRINQIRRKGRPGTIVSHHTFIPVSLSLDIAISASEQARESFDAIEFHTSQFGRDIDQAVKHDSDGLFLEYFKQFFVAVTFSVQSIEMFCNEIIGEKLGETGTVVLRGREYTGAGVERAASIEEKVEYVVPRLLLVKPVDRKSRLWSDFKRLSALRDEIVHPKYDRLYHDRQTPGIVDTTSLWHTLYNRDVSEQPRTAALVLHHFGQFIEPEPRWMPHIIERFAVQCSQERPAVEPKTTTITVRPHQPR